ncbi:hypothetical protein AGDE_13093 [Angomonas deanei]|nr:hypothetical protein AGDE_13093 [Angomonas deanei]|eukprot:EPY22740.1 hypothetical protein AGDE_13093 [Angomonas deanei]
MTGARGKVGAIGHCALSVAVADDIPVTEATVHPGIPWCTHAPAVLTLSVGGAVPRAGGISFLTAVAPQQTGRRHHKRKVLSRCGKNAVPEHQHTNVTDTCQRHIHHLHVVGPIVSGWSCGVPR